LEKAKNVYVLPATFDWNDLGTWGQLHEKLDKDGQNNAVVNATVILKKMHPIISFVPMEKNSSSLMDWMILL